MIVFIQKSVKDKHHCKDKKKKNERIVCSQMKYKLEIWIRIYSSTQNRNIYTNDFEKIRFRYHNIIRTHTET